MDEWELRDFKHVILLVDFKKCIGSDFKWCKIGTTNFSQSVFQGKFEGV